MPAVLAAHGFIEARISDRFDCFAGTRKERTARRHGVFGANILARKPR